MKPILQIVSSLLVMQLISCEPEPPDTVGEAPVASFTASSTMITAGQSVQFTDQSTNSPSKWNWDFGDGSAGNSTKNPTHTYNIAGIYTVKLTVTNNSGSDTKAYSDYITVNPAGSTPVSAFTASKTVVAVGISIQFTDQSTNSPTTWSWEFGDGGTSASQNPTHAYISAGTYTVKLTVSNIFGSNSEIKTNYIIAGNPPVAAFTASSTQIEEGQSIQFTDQSTNMPTGWSWDFGDGGTIASRNPSHLYSTAGTYTIKLTVSNNYGTDTETKDNYIRVSEKTSGAFTDGRDGHTYNWVMIGDQIWMAENLAYLPSVSPPSSGSSVSFYYYVVGYEGSSVSAAKATENFETYGVLYNWPAAMQACDCCIYVSNGVCPVGWHLPNDAEWTELTDFLGGESVAGGKMKEEGIVHWKDENISATNESGFTGLPGSYRSKTYGTFVNFGTYAMFWSSTDYNTTDAKGRGLYNLDGKVYNYNYFKDHGFSVRCIKDD